MDMDRDRGFAGRLEIVETGRRRRWSDAEKVRIVEESLGGHRQASATARRHGIPVQHLFRWRKAYREGDLGSAVAPAAVAPAVLSGREAEAVTGRPAGSGRMEIVLLDGRRVVVGSDVDGAALGRVLDVLEGRR